MKPFSTFKTLTAALTAATFTGFAQAGDPADAIDPERKPGHHSNLWDDHRVDSHAPIGVMADHTHAAGEWMLSYRFMTMSMGDNYTGDNRIADADVISPAGEGYLVTPTEMTTDMHMIGIMRAPTDELTLMAMVPFLDKSMDHLRRDGVRFNTAASGIGDVKFGGMFKFFDEEHQRIHLNFSLSAPTGTTGAEDVIPGLGVTTLPYPMQLGSGTWDLLPGLTYLGQSGDLSWGAQALTNIRLGSNDEGYQLGDSYTGNLWMAYRLCDCASASVRVAGSTWGNIDGSDHSLAVPAGAVPTADPNLRGGDRIDVFGGLNLYGTNEPVKGHRLAIEAGGTVWQDLDGPQLGLDWMLIVGWQKAF